MKGRFSWTEKRVEVQSHKKLVSFYMQAYVEVSGLILPSQLSWLLISIWSRWCSLLYLQGMRREEQDKQIDAASSGQAVIWTHFPLPHSLLQTCGDFPMRKRISAWSGKGFLLIVWLLSKFIWLTSMILVWDGSNPMKACLSVSTIAAGSM